MGPTTLHAFFSRAFPNGRASVRFRDGAGFEALTAEAVRARVVQLAAALVTYGFEPGARAAIYCAEGPQAFLAESAVMASGGVAVPIANLLSEEALSTVLRESKARIVLVSDSERLRQMIFVRPDLPNVDLVLIFGGGDADRPAAATRVDAACARGTEALARDPDILARAVRGVGGADGACLLLGPGPPPRPVLLSQENVVGAARSLANVLQLAASDDVLLAQEDAQSLRRSAALGALASGASVAFASAERLAEDLDEVAPTVAFVDRVALAEYQDSLSRRIASKGLLSRPVHRWAVAQGRKRAAASLSEGRMPGGSTAVHRLADRVSLRSLRGRGGSRLRFFVSSGPPLPVERSSFLFAVGLPVLEGYATPEASGVLAVNTPTALRLGTVGSPVPGVEVRIGEGGRIEVRGPLAAGSSPDGAWIPTDQFGRLEGKGYLVVSGTGETGAP
jgi:long-chain acyl-CoA synthetase